MNPGVCVVTNLLCCVKSKMSLFHNDLLIKVCAWQMFWPGKTDAHALWHRLFELGDILQKSDDMNVKTMMTSSNENMFYVTCPLWAESTGHRWIPHTKASDMGLRCFLWSAPE